MLTDMPAGVTQKQIEDFFRQACVQRSTSMFQSVSLISALKMAYVVFPSIISAKVIYSVRHNLKEAKTLNGQVVLPSGVTIPVSYSSSSFRHNSNQSEQAPQQMIEPEVQAYLA